VGNPYQHIIDTSPWAVNLIELNTVCAVYLHQWHLGHKNSPDVYLVSAFTGNLAKWETKH
jgi:hypothetical protein